MATALQILKIQFTNLVLSLESIRIALTTAALQGVSILAADMSNTYIQDPSSKKHFIICGLEFGLKHQGKQSMIVQEWESCRPWFLASPEKLYEALRIWIMLGLPWCMDACFHMFRWKKLLWIFDSLCWQLLCHFWKSRGYIEKLYWTLLWTQIRVNRSTLLLPWWENASSCTRKWSQGIGLSVCIIH